MIIMLPKGTKLCIEDALYFSKSSKNLLRFKDIRYNGYHIETNSEGNEEFLYITSIVLGQKLILEKLPSFSSRLYYTIVVPRPSGTSLSDGELRLSIYLLVGFLALLLDVTSNTTLIAQSSHLLSHKPNPNPF